MFGQQPFSFWLSIFVGQRNRPLAQRLGGKVDERGGRKDLGSEGVKGRGVGAGKM